MLTTHAVSHMSCCQLNLVSILLFLRLLVVMKKLRLHFNDRRKLSTDFEIVEQGDVPFLMSLAQMRNLEFQFKLGPKYAVLTSAALGIKDFPLLVGNTGHLLLDLVQLG